jgi:hypothetical protein
MEEFPSVRQEVCDSCTSCMEAPKWLTCPSQHVGIPDYVEGSGKGHFPSRYPIRLV